MEAAYDGRQVVGMDLHCRRSLLARTVRAESGRPASRQASPARRLAGCGVVQRV